mmetsp:Transcript_114245/g.323050  ORF Transcript_114245/g.323050 Transcript_114245/m.323050 type:complete len:209 (+) Transcript_114245:705-1331(+)
MKAKGYPCAFRNRSLYFLCNSTTALMSASWKVVSRAAVFCASLSRCITRFLTKDKGTRRCFLPSTPVASTDTGFAASGFAAAAAAGATVGSGSPMRLAASLAKVALSPCSASLGGGAAAAAFGTAAGAAAGADAVAAAGAAAGAEAAAAAGPPAGGTPPVSIFMSTFPTSTVSSALKRTSLMVPASAVLTSTVTLSVSMSAMTSPAAT